MTKTSKLRIKITFCKVAGEPVTQQYNLVLDKGLWCCTAGPGRPGRPGSLSLVYNYNLPACWLPDRDQLWHHRLYAV